MSELIITRPPTEPEQYISVDQAFDNYTDYYLTVDHEAGDAIVWISEYIGTVSEDRRFKLADLEATVAWLKSAADGEEWEQDDLGRWQKDLGDTCSLYLPCGDTLDTTVRQVELVLLALKRMTSVREWSGPIP